MTSAIIAATGVVCAAGFGAEQVWASTRSRLSCIRLSSVADSNMNSIPMGLVPDEALDSEDTTLDLLELPARARRMLCLAAPVLRELAPSLGETAVTLYLGLPELDPASSPWIEGFAAELCSRAGLKFDAAASRTFPLGRAAALVAIESALAELHQDESRAILVGGVDTFMDLRLLGSLGAEGRVLGAEVMDGFIPGEGAGFVLLQSPAQPAADALFIHAAASCTDSGHRYGTEPGRGEGLAKAMETLRALPTFPAQRIRATLTGLNGENLEAKLWGVASLRHADLFDPGMTLEHPASCFGDTGAACGAILVVIAAAALARGHRDGPVLVWAASDREQRGCTIIGATAPAS
jgi:3-oxoacyl-[acyl-carrier-protein] synthase-1